jgi:hypothetical protein
VLPDVGAGEAVAEAEGEGEDGAALGAAEGPSEGGTTGTADGVTVVTDTGATVADADTDGAAAVGNAVGCALAVGAAVGSTTGCIDTVGCTVGLKVPVGWLELGTDVGCCDTGCTVRTLLGAVVGQLDGCEEEGNTVGVRVGATVGATDIPKVGARVGSAILRLLMARTRLLPVSATIMSFPIAVRPAGLLSPDKPASDASPVYLG